MEATTVPQSQQQDKFLVRNNTAGYIGVIEIDHRGEELGVNIEPFGARWMTEAEMVATARAPRDPSDNPFEEQTYWRQDPETQRRESFKLRPLTLETDSDRFVPSNERYVPTQDAPQDSSPAVEQQEAKAPSPSEAPPSTGSQADAPAPAPEAPVAAQDAPGPALRTQAGTPATEASTGLSGAQAPPGGAERDEAESWVQPPERPGEVVAGSLSGADEPPPEEAAEAAGDPTDHPQGERHVPVAGQAQAAPQTPGAEEHAAVDQDIGEETGAAKPPAQRQPEGEFARAEEVGSPEAPEADDGDDATLVGG